MSKLVSMMAIGLTGKSQVNHKTILTFFFRGPITGDDQPPVTHMATRAADHEKRGGRSAVTAKLHNPGDGDTKSTA